MCEAKLCFKIEQTLKTLTETVELGGLVPYPDDGSEASDHLLPSALKGQKKLFAERPY